MNTSVQIKCEPPKTISYRLVVVRNHSFPGEFYVDSVNNELHEAHIETRSWFVRWLGPRQTVEV